MDISILKNDLFFMVLNDYEVLDSDLIVGVSIDRKFQHANSMSVREWQSEKDNNIRP